MPFYILFYHSVRWLALIANKSYCFILSTWNLAFLLLLYLYTCHRRSNLSATHSFFYFAPIVHIMTFPIKVLFCSSIEIMRKLVQLKSHLFPNSRPTFMIRLLTHWGRVTHICVSKLTIIGSDNGLSPGRCQDIIRTNAGLLLIRPSGTNYSEC